MDIADALTSAAKGVAAGAVAGPVGMAVGGLGGLVLDMAPSLAKWLFGDSGGQTVAAVADAVKSVTGTSDADAALAALAKDPQAAINLRIQLAQIAAQREVEQDKAAEAARQAQIDELKARLDDVAGARNQTVELAKAGSKIAYGAPIVSVVVLAVFGVAMWSAFHAAPGTESATQIGIQETLKTLATMVVAYWVGSSRGSAVKDARIHELTAGKARDAG